MPKCCDFHAGMLKTPIRIETAARVSDGAGGYVESWATLAGSPDRAHVKATSGYERFQSDRIEAQTRWRATIRYFDGITEGDRIVINNRAHNIRFINNLEMEDKWLQIDLDGGVAT